MSRSTAAAAPAAAGLPDDVRHLADGLGLERFARVGFSNGGPHAAACAYTLSPRLSGAALVALARRNPQRAERILLRDASDADRRLFAQPERAGRFGADLAGAGSVTLTWIPTVALGSLSQVLNPAWLTWTANIVGVIFLVVLATLLYLRGREVITYTDAYARAISGPLPLARARSLQAADGHSTRTVITAVPARLAHLPN